MDKLTLDKAKNIKPGFKNNCWCRKKVNVSWCDKIKARVMRASLLQRPFCNTSILPFPCLRPPGWSAFRSPGSSRSWDFLQRGSDSSIWANPENSFRCSLCRVSNFSFSAFSSFMEGTFPPQCSRKKETASWYWSSSVRCSPRCFFAVFAKLMRHPSEWYRHSLFVECF